MLTSLHGVTFTYEKQEGLYQTRSPGASLPLKDQVPRHTTVKWPIVGFQAVVELRFGTDYKSFVDVQAFPLRKNKVQMRWYRK